MTLKELREQMPDLVAHAIVDSEVHDDSEVAVVEEDTTAPPPPPVDDKDKRIADLEGQLAEMNRVLAEQANRQQERDKDGDRSTNIYIGIDGAKAGTKRGGTNPLTMAYLRRQRNK